MVDGEAFVDVEVESFYRILVIGHVSFLVATTLPLRVNVMETRRKG